MAASAIVLSSSSPVRGDFVITPTSAQHPTAYDSNSSPSLPSVAAILRGELTKKAPTLRSGSHAAQIPESAPTGFNSTSTLLKKGQLSLEDAAAHDDPPRGDERKTGSRTKATKAELQTQDAPKAERKSRKTKSATVPDIEARPKRSKRSQDRQHVDQVDIQGPEDRFVGHGVLTSSELATGGSVLRVTSSGLRHVHDYSIHDIPTTQSITKGQKQEDATNNTNEPGTESSVQRRSKSKAKRKATPKDGDDHPVESHTKRIKVARESSNKMHKSKRDEVANSTDTSKETLDEGKKPFIQVKKTGTISQHFDKTCAETRPIENSKAAQKERTASEPLELDAAVARRRQWTPIKDTIHPQAESPRLNSSHSSQPTIGPSPSKSSFADAMKSFKHDEPESSRAAEPSNAADLPKKDESVTNKRRIETIVPLLPAGPAQNARERTNSRSTSPEKKALKPAKTITELTLNGFKQVSKPQAESTKSDFFAARSESGSTSATGKDSVGFKRPANPSSRKSKSSKAHKRSLEKTKLLAPDAFVDKLGRQNLLFGSSSQLVNDSTQEVRDINRVIKESEEMARAEGVTLEVYNSVRIVGKASLPAPADLGGGLTRTRKKASLWDETREGDDEPYVPTQKRMRIQQTVEIQNKCVDESEYMDISDIMNGPAAAKNQVPPSSAFPANDGGFAFDDSEAAQDLPAAANYQKPCSDVAEAVNETVSADTATVMNSIEISQQELGIDLQLDAQVSDKGMGSSRPLSSQSALLMLNERRKARSVLEPLSSNTLPTPNTSFSVPFSKSPEARGFTTSSAQRAPRAIARPPSPPQAAKMPRNTTVQMTDVLHPPTKHPRGRPRKDAATSSSTKSVKPPSIPRKRAKTTTGSPKTTTTKKLKQPKTVAAAGQRSRTPDLDASSDFVHIDDLIDEIEDSETDISLSPPRRSRTLPPDELELVPSPFKGKNTKSTATRKTGSRTTETDRLKEYFEPQSEHVFRQITETVKAAPRTSDPKKPSWNEKILMYDPIVLEDFTAWLNEQGLKWKPPPRSNGRAKSIKRKTKAKSTNGKGKQEVGTAPEDDSKDGEVDKATPAGEQQQYMVVNEDEENAGQVVQAALELFIVQKWCESRSVCCLRKEGLRGGVKANY
ncbi:hypothetical protein NA57DRAFT_81078 [Rhizodiscina lignyota]|uniref:Structure-specific endonuclease subunit SLX4 n=1 Tax=Rhizodiscina lignyota TaxID=1504668 RepID=A0A9P4I243_9PEZI|nr:hypothetical protein NA57DRAFT_81078 [Rhizodiscina lignyota]